MQRVRELPVIQRAAFAQHFRTRRCKQQLGGTYQEDYGADTHPAAARTLQGVYHRRGAHALNRCIQCFPQNTWGTAFLCHFHSRHHRKAEDTAHDSLTMPDIRFRAHDCGQHHCPPEECCRQRRNKIWGRGIGGDSREGRRRNARCPFHLRPGCQLLPGQHHIRESHWRPKCAWLRQLFPYRWSQFAKQGQRHNAPAQRHHLQGIRPRSMYWRSGTPYT